ncbi:signal peptide containing protein, putative [Babesia ovata]|uniref:Signal peptide containing protein, putative n=1 Tax=Babesia ovata TaxID=189622 RepID=A0A2H6KIB7_9APIC|nr:signal peptide containing protein, putative [Babesia ovata]GBE62737.1 signal peptide containing protein, putative [Babesia ovata]
MYSSDEALKDAPLATNPVTVATPVVEPQIEQMIPVQQDPPKPSVVKCRVTENIDSETSPLVEVKGVNGLFNSVLVGYQDPESLTHENKGSFFGWSTVINAQKGNKACFTFNANFVPIRTKIHPTSYCALIIQPPLMASSEILEAFKSPPRSVRRSLTSTDALAKYLKEKKSSIVTSCCFLAQANVGLYDTI